MKITYIKADASGNTTAMVKGSFDRADYAKISAAMIEKRELGIEQVGFIEKPENKTSKARLQMMGGEFCGNALRSFAAYLLLSDKYAPTSGMVRVPVEISGNEGTMYVLVVPGEKKRCLSMADMPLPTRIIHDENRFLGRISIVEFEGIVHIVIWDDIAPDDKYIIPAKEILAKYSIEKPCIGLMFFKKEEKKLTPIVFVEAAKTAVYESSCGSGTAAVVCALSSMLQASIPELIIKQPQGELSASATVENGKLINCGLTGEIFLYDEKEIEIEI